MAKMTSLPTDVQARAGEIVSELEAARLARIRALDHRRQFILWCIATIRPTPTLSALARALGMATSGVYEHSLVNDPSEYPDDGAPMP